MSKRHIVIKAKQTSASTTYYDMDIADKDFLFNTLTKYMADMLEQSHWHAQLRNVMFTEDKNLQKRFNKHTNRWEKNSIASFMGGMVYNYRKHNGKNDVSKPQLDSIEYLFKVFHAYDGMCQEIEFVDSDTINEESEYTKNEFFNNLFDRG